MEQDVSRVRVHNNGAMGGGKTLQHCMHIICLNFSWLESYWIIRRNHRVHLLVPCVSMVYLWWKCLPQASIGTVTNLQTKSHNLPTTKMSAQEAEGPEPIEGGWHLEGMKQSCTCTGCGNTSGSPYEILLRESFHCVTCGVLAKDQNLFNCSQCNTTRYCSETCQRKDWTAGHKTACKVCSTIITNCILSIFRFFMVVKDAFLNLTIKLKKNPIVTLSLTLVGEVGISL
jgi:hypothetical protein